MAQSQFQEQSLVTEQEIRNKVLACLNADPELILNAREDFYYLEFNDFDLGRPETKEEEAKRRRFDNFYNYERILKTKEIGWNRIIPKIVNENGKKVIRVLLETPEEAQKRLFENIEEAAEKVRRDIKKSDGKLQYIEGELDLICNMNDFEELKLFFKDKRSTLFDDNRHYSPFNSLIKKNYKNAQNRVYKLEEKLFDKGWELCSLAPLTDFQIEELTDNGYIPFLDWTGKTYKGFSPFDFTYSQVNELIGNGYQASDLDGREYKGKNPFEKSKTEWDKFLSQKQGTNSSSNPNANGNSTPPPNNNPNQQESPPPNNDKKEQEENQKIINLLGQVQENSSYEELAAIISELKKYRSTNAYRRHEPEINQLEARLKDLNSDKYQETVNNLLDEQLKNSGLKEENLSQETKEKLEAAKNDTNDPQKVKQAEEALAKEGAKNELNRIIDSVKKLLARKDTTRQERENLIKQLSQFIISNDYAKEVYQLQKSEVDRMLAELKGQEGQSNQSPQKPFSHPVLFLSLISLFIGIVITGVLVIKNKKLRKKT